MKLNSTPCLVLVLVCVSALVCMKAIIDTSSITSAFNVATVQELNTLPNMSARKQHTRNTGSEAKTPDLQIFLQSLTGERPDLSPTPDPSPVAPRGESVRQRYMRMQNHTNTNVQTDPSSVRAESSPIADVAHIHAEGSQTIAEPPRYGAGQPATESSGGENSGVLVGVADFSSEDSSNSQRISEHDISDTTSGSVPVAETSSGASNFNEGRQGEKQGYSETWCQAPDVTIRTNRDTNRVVHLNSDHKFCLTREICHTAIRDTWVMFFGDSETRGLALGMLQIFDPDQHAPFDSERWFNVSGVLDMHQIYMDYVVSGTGEVLDKMYSAGNAKEVFTRVPQVDIPPNGFRITYMMTTNLLSLMAIVSHFMQEHHGNLPDVTYLNAGAWGKGWRNTPPHVIKFYNVTERQPGKYPAKGNGVPVAISMPMSLSDLLMNIPYLRPDEKRRAETLKGNRTFLIWGTHVPHRNLWVAPDSEAAIVTPCIFNRSATGRWMWKHTILTYAHSSMMAAAVDAQLLLGHIHEMRFGTKIAGNSTLRFNRQCAGFEYVQSLAGAQMAGFLSSWKVDCSYRTTTATWW